MSAKQEHHIEEPHDEPSDRKLLTSMVGWVGVILIFALIVFIAYLPNRTGPVDEQVAERRLSIRDEVTARETALVQNFQRAPTGSIRVPVERAMQLMPPILNQKPVRPAPSERAQPSGQQQQQAQQPAAGQSGEASSGQGDGPDPEPENPAGAPAPTGGTAAPETAPLQ